MATTNAAKTTDAARTDTVDPIRTAAVTRRRLQKEIEYVRSVDASRGEIQGRGELTVAFSQATTELDRLCDEVLGREQ
jgi:hypothetical protein